MTGVGVYRVRLGGTEITVPGFAGAAVLTGPSVVVLMKTEAGQALAVLGVAKP
jgi:hypothetical protein